MPIFLICFIVFIIWLRVKLKHNDSDISSKNDAYWEREAQANFSRKQDITSLPYLEVAKGTLPYTETPSETERVLQETVKEYSARKMLNLSQYSNTDLKEKYGSANLEELSGYDQNFLFFIRALNNWGKYLYEQEDYTRSKQIMEYSQSIGSDISSVFTTLANIYAKEKQPAKINELLDFVEQSDFSLKDSIIRKIKLCRLEC